MVNLCIPVNCHSLIIFCIVIYIAFYTKQNTVLHKMYYRWSRNPGLLVLYDLYYYLLGILYYYAQVRAIL